MNPSRKLKRLLTNGVKKGFKKALPDIVKFNLGDDRDKEIERRKDHEIAAKIYERWYKRFVQIRKTPEEVTQSIQDLANEVEAKLHSKEMVEYMLKEIIWPCITRSHELSELVNNTPVTVTAYCACHTVHQAVVPLKAWLNKDFSLECEKCGLEIKAEDCAELKKKKGKK